MTCAVKLDYSEEKVRRFNLTFSSLAYCAQRQDTGQDVWSQIRVQWISITSFVPCYAPHFPQHVAVSLFGPLNQTVISSAPSAKTEFVYLDKAYPDKQVSIWSFLLLDGLPAKAMSSIHPSLGFV